MPRDQGSRAKAVSAAAPIVGPALAFVAIFGTGMVMIANAMTTASF